MIPSGILYKTGDIRDDSPFHHSRSGGERCSPYRAEAFSAYPSPMALWFQTRQSDSPWVDTVWTCTSEQVAEMTSDRTGTQLDEDHTAFALPKHTVS